jgi:hypothetical protein
VLSPVAFFLHHQSSQILADTFIVGVGQFLSGEIILEGAIDEVMRFFYTHMSIEKKYKLSVAATSYAAMP